MARTRRGAGASSLINDVKAMGSALLETRKLAGAEKLATLADAAKTLSGSLEDTPIIRQYTETAADGLDALSRYIERSDIDEIFDDAVELAKQQPILMLTLTIVGGIAVTQMLRGWRVEPRPSAAARSVVKRRGQRKAKPRKR